MRNLNPKTVNLLENLRRGEKYSINYDPFDLENFGKLKASTKELLEISDLGSKDYEPFPELMQDTYDALFKNNPDVTEEWKMRTDFLLNRGIMMKLVESARYKELRAMTQHDEVTSALGTEVMAKELIEWLKQAKEQVEAQQELAKAVAGVLSAGTGDGTEAEANPLLTLEEAMRLYEEAKEKFDGTIQDKAFSQGLERLTSRVKDTVQETSEMITNWGLDRTSTFTNLPVNEKLGLVERLLANDHLKEIARLAGRYRMMAMQVRRDKVKKGITENHSIIPGSDLSRVIPSELMKMKHPSTRKAFMSDFIEGKLLTYEIRGKDKKQKGPIIICIDESGSMTGLPDIWAKSVALALFEIARAQKRDFFVIHFSSQTSVDKLHTNEFLKDKPFDIEQMIDMAGYFEGGGTTFEPPLDLARQKIGDGKSWSKADIIFVTDGESAVAEEWYQDFNKWRKENKVKVYSILIDSGPNTSVVLKLFSDQVEKLSNLKTGMSKDILAVNIFGSI